MIIGTIVDGIVIDHIPAGRAMDLYRDLGLDKLECEVAVIKNASSGKYGKKDILKINEVIDLNYEMLGYIDPHITVNIIRGGRADGEDPSSPAGDHHRGHPVQESPVHHLHRAGAAPHLPSHRPGARGVPLPVL